MINVHGLKFFQKVGFLASVESSIREGTLITREVMSKAVTSCIYVCLSYNKEGAVLLRIEEWDQNGDSVTFTPPPRENWHLNCIEKTNLGHTLTLF